MKIKTLLITVFTLSVYVVSFSQGTNDISKVPPVSKGKIILNDGLSMNFKQLSVLKDTVVFTNSQSQIIKYPAKDVYKITKTGNNAAMGAVTCGLGGLLGGVLGTSNWKTVESLKGKEGSFIIGATIVCTLIGGITGALIKRDKTIYKSSSPLTILPGVGLYPDRSMGFFVTCRIPINLK